MLTYISSAYDPKQTLIRVESGFPCRVEIGRTRRTVSGLQRTRNRHPRQARLSNAHWDRLCGRHFAAFGNVPEGNSGLHSG